MPSSKQNQYGRLLKWSLVASITLAAVSIGLSAYLFTTRPDGFYNSNPFAYGQFFSLHFGFFPTGGILLLIAIFLVARWLVWRGRPNYCSLPPVRDAISTLKDRYASGEISKEQFEQMVQDIQRVSQACGKTG